jgi:hypothetical protein
MQEELIPYFVRASTSKTHPRDRDNECDIYLTAINGAKNLKKKLFPGVKGLFEEETTTTINNLATILCDIKAAKDVREAKTDIIPRLISKDLGPDKKNIYYNFAYALIFQRESKDKILVTKVWNSILGTDLYY